MVKKKNTNNYVKMTPHQKSEYRRLVQLANRRIVAAYNTYSSHDKEVLPIEIVGKKELQTIDKWHTPKMPIDRGIKLTEKEYKEKLKFLRSFDPKATRSHRPGIKEYTEVQRHKVSLAIATSELGEDVTYQVVMEKLSKLSAPLISDFWNAFSDKAARLGVNYSSDAAMAETYAELFPEDLKGVASPLKRTG